ncbi:MAG: hypothetical protein IH861_07320 [Chloroflexi bacterium]|nr:hypothetical protein [Chloroflexota bacterium]
MTNLKKDDVLRLAAQAGLDVDDARAEAIAFRLAAVMEELDEITAEALEGVEPALTFSIEEPASE